MGTSLLAFDPKGMSFEQYFRMEGRPEFETIAGMPLWAMEVYYRYLNCGFHLPVSAGSASGVMAAEFAPPIGAGTGTCEPTAPGDPKQLFPIANRPILVHNLEAARAAGIA